MQVSGRISDDDYFSWKQWEHTQQHHSEAEGEPLQKGGFSEMDTVPSTKQLKKAVTTKLHALM